MFLLALLLWLDFYLFIYYCSRRHLLQHLQRFLQCTTYIILEFTPSVLFHLLSPNSWNSFNSLLLMLHQDKAPFFLGAEWSKI